MSEPEKNLRCRPLADGALGDLHARRDRGHPDQGRAGPLPDPRVRHPPAADLGDVRRPDVHPGHADPHPPGRLPREVLDTKTVLGTRFASQPIELDIPLMVTGMSYGALSRNAKAALSRGADGGHLDDDRRRRHARRRAGRVAGDGLRGPAQPLRDRRPAPPPGRRDRADDRPGGQAGHRRPAARARRSPTRSPGSATCPPASISARLAGTPTSSAPTTW